jgi:hypothetical protein
VSGMARRLVLAAGIAATAAAALVLVLGHGGGGGRTAAPPVAAASHGPHTRPHLTARERSNEMAVRRQMHRLYLRQADSKRLPCVLGKGARRGVAGASHHRSNPASPQGVRCFVGGDLSRGVAVGA